MVAASYLWDPVEDNIVKELEDAGGTIADYTTEPYLYGGLVSQHRGGQPRFHHNDGQGSTTALTDAAANVTYTYDPVGNRLQKNSTGVVTISTFDAANQLVTSIGPSGTRTRTES